MSDPQRNCSLFRLAIKRVIVLQRENAATKRTQESIEMVADRIPIHTMGSGAARAETMKGKRLKQEKENSLEIGGRPDSWETTHPPIGPFSKKRTSGAE